MKRTNEAFSDSGKGNAAAAVVPSQLYLAHSWGGACARGAVGGGRQIASRTIRTRIDLGRRGREDFFAAWRPQWCVPCLVCWTEDLVCSVMCCYQGGQLLDATSGAMDGRGTCYLLGGAGEWGATEVEDSSEKPGFNDELWAQDWGGGVGM